MKTTANRNTMNVPVTHVADVPPRWGLGFVEDLARYKHGAPLALGGSRPPEPDVSWRRGAINMARLWRLV